MHFLRTTSTGRLLALLFAAAAVCAGTAAIAIAATTGGGRKPPPKPLANAVHQALAAPTVPGVSARISFTNHLVDASAIPGASPLLSGASGRLWAAPGGRVRIELQSTNGDAQIVSNGKTVLVYDGTNNTAYRANLPSGKTVAKPGKDAPPSLADIARSIAQVRQHAGISGAIPTTVAGQPAYEVRISPRRGGLLSQLRTAWDAVRGVPLRLALYSRGNGSPVVSLTVKKISYGPVSASTFAVTPPKGAQVNDLSPRSGGRSTNSAKRLSFTPTAPDRLVGMPRTQIKPIGSKGAAALITYGKGLGGIAVIEQKSDGRSPSGTDHGGGQLPSVSIGGATGQELPTALGTIVRFERGGVSYTVLGSQPSSVVLAAARSL